MSNYVETVLCKNGILYFKSFTDYEQVANAEECFFCLVFVHG